MRRIETAASPSRSASAMAVRAMASRSRDGSGPRDPRAGRIQITDGAVFSAKPHFPYCEHCTQFLYRALLRTLYRGIAMDEFDVAIAGGGPAGLALALELAQGGARVVVLEARPDRDDPALKGMLAPRSINRASGLLLARLG